jgi:hypothetical protein
MQPVATATEKSSNCANEKSFVCAEAAVATGCIITPEMIGFNVGPRR